MKTGATPSLAHTTHTHTQTQRAAARNYTETIGTTTKAPDCFIPVINSSLQETGAESWKKRFISKIIKITKASYINVKATFRQCNEYKLRQK